MGRVLPNKSVLENQQQKDFEKRLDDMIIKNQDWFFPVISAIAIGGISTNIDTIKIMDCSIQKFCVLAGIFLYGATLLLILSNLFVSIYFAVKLKEGQKIKF